MIIEKGVPIPTNSRGRKAKYPFAQMDVGDSFFVPDWPAAKKVKSAWYQYHIKTGAKFSVMKDGDGYRCWRRS